MMQGSRKVARLFTSRTIFILNLNLVLTLNFKGGSSFLPFFYKDFTPSVIIHGSRSCTLEKVILGLNKHSSRNLIVIIKKYKKRKNKFPKAGDNRIIIVEITITHKNNMTITFVLTPALILCLHINIMISIYRDYYNHNTELKLLSAPPRSCILQSHILSLRNP